MKNRRENSLGRVIGKNPQNTSPKIKNPQSK